MRREHDFSCEACLNCITCGIAMREVLCGSDRLCVPSAVAHGHLAPAEEEPYVPEWAIPLGGRRRHAS